MRIDHVDGATLVVHLDDGDSSPLDLRQAVMDELTGRTQIVIIDCAGVAFLHSPSLAAITALHMALKEQGRALRIRNLNEQNQRAFRHTRLVDIIDIE